VVRKPALPVSGLGGVIRQQVRKLDAWIHH
jgi:hypothetical protein